jgi:hypothetical protein
VAFYTRTREEHWLRDKHEDGIAVILEDESMWEIYPSDHVITSRWLRMSTIIVEHTQKESCPYLLKNSTERETARANFLGDLPRRKPTEVA